MYDFGRSFLQFRSLRVNHTPRLQLDAACRLRYIDGTERQFVLTAPCIGERMYVSTGLVHEPTIEFLMVGEHHLEYAIHRKHAAFEQLTPEVGRVGDSMGTISGVPARVVAVDIHLAMFKDSAPITTYEAFREALLENHPINGRTTYTAEDGQTTVILDYPCKTVNVGHGREVWQVDAGPLIIPNRVTPESPDDVLAGHFELAYMVFNTWDYAEVAIRQATPVRLSSDASSQNDGQSSDAGVPKTAHFSKLHPLTARHELFYALD